MAIHGYTWLYMGYTVFSVFFVRDDDWPTPKKRPPSASRFLSAGRKVHLLRRGGRGWRQGGTWDGIHGEHHWTDGAGLVLDPWNKEINCI